MTLTLTLLALLLAGATGTLLARAGISRAAAQPLHDPRDEESTVLGTLLADPAKYQLATTLTEDDIASPEHRAAWRILTEAAGPCPHEQDTSQPCGCTLSDDQHAEALAAIARENGPEYAARAKTSAAADDDEFIRAGEKILEASEDRQLTGFIPVTLLNDGTPERVIPRVGGTRIGITTALLGITVVAALSTALAADYPNTTSFLLGAAALLVLAYGATLWASVDADTLYIDTPTLWPVGTAAGALTIAASLTAGQWERLIPGIGFAIGVVILFEGSNLLYRILRGRNGLSGGDARLAIVTIGVPAGIMGTWSYGYACLIASLILGAAAYPVLRALGHEGRSIPFAFGPYLATGWAAVAIVTPVALLVSGAAA